MIQKRVSLLISALISAVLLVADIIGTFKLCGGREYGTCMDLLYDIIVNFTLIIPFFVFSLITYKMRDDVYRTWFKFSYIAIPLFMLLIFIAPEYDTHLFYPVDKPVVTFLTLWIYVSISILIIGWKYFKTRST